jgi:hypothetical protein
MEKQEKNRTKKRRHSYWWEVDGIDGTQIEKEKCKIGRRPRDEQTVVGW